MLVCPWTPTWMDHVTNVKLQTLWARFYTDLNDQMTHGVMQVNICKDIGIKLSPQAPSDLPSYIKTRFSALSCTEIFLGQSMLIEVNRSLSKLIKNP